MIACLCAKVEATTFISGSGARAYLDVALLRDHGVEVEWQVFTHPTYRQLHPQHGFVPGLAAIDLLLNEGLDSRTILHAQRRRSLHGS